MVKWLLTYELKIKFSAPVTDHHFSLRCLPLERSCQNVKSMQLIMTPDAPISFGTDGHGNQYAWGTVREAHEDFIFRVVSEVECHEAYLEETKSEHSISQFRSQTKLTTMSPAMLDFLQKLNLDQYQDAETKLDELNKAVWGHIIYTPGSTNVKTTAEEAFDECKGVCQDYAHVLLALLRHEGYLARYVAGAIVGEGESHAWVEVLLNGRWIPLDPTHCRRGNEYYIAFAVGRDATETNLSKGVFNGFVTQKQEVVVKMEAIDND